MKMNKPIPPHEIDADDIFSKTLDQLTAGKLSKKGLESRNMNFESVECSSFKPMKSINKSYIQNYETVIDEISIPSSLNQGRIQPNYLKQHSLPIDVPMTKKVKGSPDQLNHEEESSVSKIPIDVQVKMEFLDKNIVRCCGTTVFIYNSEFGYFEEQTETSLYVAIRKSISSELDLRLGKQKIAEVVHRIVSSPDLQTSYTEFDKHTHLINFRNGVFDIRNNNWYPHNPVFYSLATLMPIMGPPPLVFKSITIAEWGNHLIKDTFSENFLKNALKEMFKKRSLCSN
ncbi:hypothetical protein AAFJ72_03435 [Brevibacillus gelatini]|uniref:hypothetical protein n=1 Tax=Brevibacillus gelatini TaxID=1655277 RepID=UPI003D81BEE9